MSYSPRYSTTIKDISSDVYTVDIEKLNYTGETLHISRGGAIKLDNKGGRSNALDSIYPSLLRLELWAEEMYANGNTGREEFEEMLDSQYKDFRVSIYKNKNSLENLTDGENTGDGVAWVLSASTVTLNDEDSKDLTLDFTGAHPNVDYIFDINFDTSTLLSGVTTVQTVPNWINRPGATGATWSTDFYNVKWQVHFDEPGFESAEMIGEVINGFGNSDLVYRFNMSLANQLHNSAFSNRVIFSLYDESFNLLDREIKEYFSQGNKTETITFTNATSAIPKYVGVYVQHRIGAGGYAYAPHINDGTIGDYWINFAQSELVSGSTGTTTTGDMFLKFYDENMNLLDSEKIRTSGFQFNTWIVPGNHTASVKVNGGSGVPAYVSIEAEHKSGDPTIVKINSISVRGESNSHLYWRGWVKQDLITTRLVSPCFILQLDCTDGLLDLKELDFPASATTSNFIQEIKAIKYCLDGTDISLNIKSQINIFNNELSGNTIASIYLNGFRFKDIKNGRVKYVNKYAALDMMLKNWNSYLIQSDGYWQIVQRNEMNSPNYVFDWDTSSEIGVETRNRVVHISGDTSLFESDTLMKIAPYKFGNIDINNSADGGNFIYNGDISDGLEGWENSTNPATAFYAFTLGTEGDGKYIKVTNPGQVGVNPNVNRYFDYTLPFNFHASTADTITFSFRAKAYAEVTGGTGGGGVGEIFNPHYKIEFQTTGGTTAWPDATGYIQPGGWKTYTQKFKVSADFHNAIVLRVWVIPRDSSSWPYFSLIDAGFDDFNLGIEYGDTDVFNTYYSATNVDTTAVANYETIQYFTDSFTVAEKASLKWAKTGTTTSTWSNYDRSFTGGSINNLQLYEILSQHNKFKDFVQLTLRSTDKDILFDNVLQVYSKKYSIVDMSKDLIWKHTELQLVEFLENQEPDLVFSSGNYETSSKSSDSTPGGGSTGGGGSSGGGGADPIIYYAGQNINIISNVISATGLVTQTAFNSYTGSTGTGSTANITVSNGLVKTGENIYLGGTLTGDTNISTGVYGIAIGNGNTATEEHSASLGGCSNNALGEFSIVLGGRQSFACGDQSGVVAGRANVACGNNAFVAGGVSNIAVGNCSAVVGASESCACGTCSGIFGGRDGTTVGQNSFIIGGRNLINRGGCSSMINGFNNEICSTTTGATVIGGSNITISGSTFHDHTIVPKLTIKSTPSTGAAADNVLVRDGSTGIVKQVRQVVQTIAVNVSSSQILNSNTTPITIIPSPGSGKFINVLSMQVFFDYNSIAYASNVSMFFRYAGTSTSINTAAMNIAQTVDKIFRFAVNANGTGESDTGIVNQPVTLSTQTGNPTAGNSTLKVYIAYEIITL